MAHQHRDLAALLALLFAACQSGPTAVPAATSVPLSNPTDGLVSSLPGPTQAANPDRTSIPLLSSEPAPPSSTVGKIRAAVAAGVLDVATGYLYRAYATVEDPLLPEAFRGERSEDPDLDLVLRSELANLPADVQDQLLPYLVRPTDPASYWNQQGTSASPGAGLGRARSLAAGSGPVPPPAATCLDGWMHDRVSSAIPVMLWARCMFEPVAAVARLEEARGYMTELWYPETSLMGLPLGDRNVENDRYPDPPEGGDGLIDVYLVNGAAAERDLSVSGFGQATPAPPFEGAAGAQRSSAYIVIRPSLTGTILKATLAHEFFHVLQYSHNAAGAMDCPIQQLSVGCRADAQQTHWFVEASATWSEHYFVPPSRPIGSGPYDWWSKFRQTTNGLSLKDGSNEYASWMWALFMQQEWGADIIGNTWRAIRGKVGWWEVQRAIDAQLSFEQRFDDFAVRVFNRELLPGDPIKPRFRAARLDPTFPDTTPGEPRYNEEVDEDLSDVLVAATTRFTYTITLSSLASAYFPFAPPPGAHTLRLEFAAFAPEIEVDAIVKVGDTWERRELPASETVWCLDSPKDAVVEGFLIFSDHDQRPGAITRPWSITAEEAGCGSQVGTLSYSFLDSAPASGWSGSSMSEDATIQVKLKADPDLGGYVNDGSTYGAHSFSHVVLPPGPDGCSPIIDSTGIGGGTLEQEVISAGPYQDDAEEWHLTLGSISLPVHFEVDESWCSAGSGNHSDDGSMLVPVCEGDALTTTDEATWTFVFDCDFQGETQAWSMSGSIIVNRSD